MFSSKSGGSEDLFSERMADLAPTLSMPSEQGEFFLPASHVQLLEKLEHLSRYSHFIQIILGVSGSGKSTLLKQLYPNADDASIQACLIRATDKTSLHSLLDGLIEQLGIDVAVTATKEDKLQAIYEHADLLEDISRLFLIVVDDAHKLDDDCLDLLVNLLQSVRNPDARPHLVMFALPKLADRMNASSRFKQAVDTICHFVELKPMDLEELQGYVQHGRSDQADLLTPAQLKRLHQESFGLPGRVPKALDKLLATPAKNTGNRRGRLGLQFPRLHLLLGFSVAVAAGGLWWLLPGAADLGAERVRVELPIPAVEEKPEATVAEIEEPVAKTLEQRLQEADARLRAESSTLDEPQEPLVEPSEPAQEIAATDSEPAGSNEASTAVATSGSLAVAPVKAEQPAADSGSVEADESQARTPKKLVLQIPSAEQDKRETAKADPAPVPPQEKPKPVMQTTTALSSPYLREEELLSWKSSGYTLQMLGARKELSVIQFIQEQRDPKDFYYFSTIYKGKPWYAIVYGNYPDRDSALAAIPTLSADLRRNKPWARSVKGVQEDIRRKYP